MEAPSTERDNEHEEPDCKDRQVRQVRKDRCKGRPQLKGHRGIRAGSRKEEAAKAFDSKKGKENIDSARTYAVEKAESLGIKAGTAKSWIGTWLREDKGPKATKAPKAPKSAKGKAEPEPKPESQPASQPTEQPEPAKEQPDNNEQAGAAS